MSCFETMGRIVEHLHNLDDASLEELLSELLDDITDATLENFPDLTKEDLKACIAFAADHERHLVKVPYLSC